MRRKTIIDGFRNGQKFRFMLSQPGQDTQFTVGMYITIKQMSENFATSNARLAVWEAMNRLANDRYLARVHRRDVPVGLATQLYGFNVQVDLCE